MAEPVQSRQVHDASSLFGTKQSVFACLGTVELFLEALRKLCREFCFLSRYYPETASMPSSKCWQIGAHDSRRVGVYVWAKFCGKDIGYIDADGSDKCLSFQLLRDLQIIDIFIDPNSIFMQIHVHFCKIFIDFVRI